MIFGIFTLAVALTISAVAAYYSIAGLCAIFAAAVVPVIIMGGALEVGKIVATVWLHKFWKRAGWQFKMYLIPAIVVLMIITSMGIFGFLSKAHMDQTVTVGDSAAQVAILDEKIATEKSNIDSAKKALQQMDSQVDQMLSRTTDDRGTNRAVQIRKQQAGERKNLQKEITEAQKHIAALQNERAPLAAQTRKIEAEVGPVKYIAALIYGDNPDANLLERAVRWVIILLVLVFDPLALVLILAGEQTIEWARADRKAKKAEGHPEGWHQEWAPDTENPWHDIPPLTDEQVTKIVQEANVDDDIEMTKFFEEGRELAAAIDANNGTVPEETIDRHAYLKKPWDWGVLKNVKPVVYTPEENKPVPKNKPEPTAQVEIPDLSIQALESKEVPTANFGSKNQLPTNPKKGDMFLRTDMLPNKLYKWNGFIWVEIDKNSTDTYTTNPEYIADLVKRLENNEFSVDYLTVAEQEQVERYLNDNLNRKQ